MVVLAAPLLVDSVAELNVHVMPETDMQDKVTLLLKPPDGVTVTVTGVDWPGGTVTLEGIRLNEKSAVEAMAAACRSVRELLGRNVASPLNRASMTRIPIPAVGKVKVATPSTNG